MTVETPATVRFTIAEPPPATGGLDVRVQFGDDDALIPGACVTVSTSTEGVDPVSACDGVPVDDMVERTAAYEGGHPGLESTKASAALATLIDQGDPFLHRPGACTISGRPVTLNWVRIPYAGYLRNIQPLDGRYDRTVSVTGLGNGVAWVRLGNFEPETPAEVADFRRVIAEAAGTVVIVVARARDVVPAAFALQSWCECIAR